MLSRVRQMISRKTGAVRDDEGAALVTVMGISVILFLLVTMLLTLSMYSTTQSRRHEKRTKALHMADAGIDAYLFEVRRDPDYYADHPELGPRTLEDGVWYVQATPPGDGTPLTLTSTGSIPGKESTVTVKATVRFPTFADYMFLSDADINIGSDATIVGRVRTNGDLNNAGRVTGKAQAAGDVTGGGVFEQGFAEHEPVIDFAQVTMDLATLRAAAQASGTYLGASGTYGYRLTFSGTTITVAKVTGGVTTGNLTTTPMGTLAVPASGALFVDDNVWVSGTYSGMATLGSSRDIYIPEDLKPQNPTAKQCLGLVAQNNVIVPTWYPSIPQNMTLTAAMLAQTGAIYGDLKTGVTRQKITITGSMAYSDYGYMASYSGSTVVAGFKQRIYEYDPRLDLYPPPMYPVVRDGSLKVDTWVEQN